MNQFFCGGVLASFVMTAGVAMADVSEGIAALEAGNVQGAAQLFQDAYDAGDADGAFYLGRLFELGLGTDKDLRRAAALYAVSAEAKSPLAQNRLGLMYLDGEFVLQDFARAAELICGAAEAGDANGQFNCGLLYAEGKGVALDNAEAVRLWEAAAESNHVAAINYLATAYRDGTGVAADAARTTELFERTASAGNPLGLFELAQAYSSGTGVDEDLVQAHVYANLAAVRGVEGAIPLRTQLGEQLSSEDLAAAQESARNWQATPLADVPLE